MIQTPSSLPALINPWLQLVVLTGAVVGVSVGLWHFLIRKKTQDKIVAKQKEIEDNLSELKGAFKESDFLVRTVLQSIGGKLDKHAEDIDRGVKEREKLSEKIDNVAEHVAEVDKKVTEVGTDVKHLLNRRNGGERRESGE